MKIKNKLTLHFTLIVGTLLLIFSLVIYFVSARFLEKEYAIRFKERINFTTNLLIKNGAVDKSVTNVIDKHTLNTFLGEKILIIDKTANIHYHSFDGNQHPFSKDFIEKVNKNNEAVLFNGHQFWYGKAITIGDSKISVIAESKPNYLEDLAQLKIFLIAGFLSTLLVVLLLGRYFAGKSLQPIAEVIQEVDETTHNNLYKRVNEGNGKDEISHLAQTFNRLLSRLHAAFELQKNFVSNASHELRTPLSSITAQLEVTLLNKRNSEEYEKVFNSILDDIRDLNQLCDGLFDLTLASRDVSLMKFGQVRIDELLLQSRSDLLKRKNEYKININFDELPEEEAQLTLLGKEHLLKSTFRNLMDNACKFSENKSVDVHLQIVSNKICIKFSDKGIGIPHSYLQNKFTPLLRGENAKRIAGHGLGLALSKKIVELHKGEISLFSEEKEGTDVTIILPIN